MGPGRVVAGLLLACCGRAGPGEPASGPGGGRDGGTPAGLAGRCRRRTTQKPSARTPVSDRRASAQVGARTASGCGLRRRPGSGEGAGSRPRSLRHPAWAGNWPPLAGSQPLPGRNIPRGSRAWRTACCSARDPGSSSRRIPSRFSRPTPCSPVTVPASAIASSRISSNAACAAARAASSPAGVMIRRMQVPVAGVGDGGDLHPVPGRFDRLDLGQHRRHFGPRDTDVFGEYRAQPLERRVDQPPGLEQRLRLGVVGGLGCPTAHPRRSWPRPARRIRPRRNHPGCPPGPAAAPPRWPPGPGASSPRRP